ncbi:MAG: carboxylating nicotinate-nucleotide diphosphorylase [Nitrososphaerales archaeon]
MLPLEIEESLKNFLREDVCSGDITSKAVLDDEVKGEAIIITKEGGTVAGLTEVVRLFEFLGCIAEPLVKDGDIIKAGQGIVRIKGKAKAILEGERVALNLLSRMSGIATETKKFLESAKRVNSKVKIACTRKTAPGLRVFDKKAVEIGGGDTHRLRLDDCALIKDNHVRLVGSVREAVKRAVEKVSFTKKVEVEVGSAKEALEAAEAGADIVMLDNMRIKEVRRVVDEFEKRGYRGKVLLEASGRINKKNIVEYAKTGVDIISVGAITHSPKALDMSLKIKRA